MRAVISAAVSTAASAFRSTFLLCRPVSFHEFSKKKSAWCTSIWEMDKMRAIVSTRISNGKRRDCGALRVAVRMLSRPSNLLTNELHTSQSSDHDFLVGQAVHPSALIPGTIGVSLNRKTTSTTSTYFLVPGGSRHKLAPQGYRVSLRFHTRTSSHQQLVRCGNTAQSKAQQPTEI